jgi:signal peptidase I
MRENFWIVAACFVVSRLYAAYLSSILEYVFAFALLLFGACYGLNYCFKYFSLQHTDELKSQGAAISPTRMRLIQLVQLLSIGFLPFLGAFLIRSFVCNFNFVVSGSLKPSILIGDCLLVHRYCYGVRLPFTGTPLFGIRSPQRGDIVVFRLPGTFSKNMLKRVIGLPGDHIHYNNKRLTINGKPITQKVLGLVQTQEEQRSFTVAYSQENLPERSHGIYMRLDEPAQIVNKVAHPLSLKTEESWVVPDGQYFMMGDNRDFSLDSRVWGCIPARCFLGEARQILFSWNAQASWLNPLAWVRWERTLMKVV